MPYKNIDDKRAYQKRYRDKNSEQLKLKGWLYRLKHKDDPAYIEKSRVNSQKWRKLNPKKHSKEVGRYQKRNRELINANARKNYKVRKLDAAWISRQREFQKISRAKRREKILFYNKRRYMLSKNIPDSISMSAFLSHRALYDRCVYCNKKMDNLTADHVVPITRGGNHSIENITFACRGCNSQKSNKSLLSFLIYRKGLWEVQNAIR